MSDVCSVYQNIKVMTLFVGYQCRTIAILATFAVCFTGEKGK